MTKLCKCGCGAIIKNSSTFVSGHNCRGTKQTSEHIEKRIRSRSFPPRLLKVCCVCGKEFSVQHYRRNAKYCSLSCKSKGEFYKSLAGGFKRGGRIPWNKGQKATEETRLKLRQSHLGQIVWNAGTGDKLKRRLNKNIGSAIACSITKGIKNHRKWETLVGWTLEALKAHLSERMKKGMNWDNYGSKWHIDHIIPIAVFHFNQPEDIDFKRCWSLSNLQPLWKEDNLKKNAKIDKPFQPMLRLQI
jgi:hypothetical protein